MDLYLFALGVGFAGLLLICLLGFGHHHAPGKPSHGGHPHSGHARHGQPVRAGRAGRADKAPLNGAMFVLGLLSPRVLLSGLLGFGAAGVLLRPLMHWPPWLLFALAAVAGWGFERLLFAPLWTLLMGFASRPARMLDSLVLEEGRAATDFDGSGHGLVAVNLDGQVRQILGALCPEERAPGTPRVRTGERLFIRAVDHQRNTCTVSRSGV